MNRISLVLLAILLSTFSFKTMAATINLFCKPSSYNKIEKDHINISFDIKSKKVFRLWGYDHNSDYFSQKEVRSFIVEPASITIFIGKITHKIDRINLRYSITIDDGTENLFYEAGEQPDDSNYFHCSKEIKTQF